MICQLEQRGGEFVCRYCNGRPLRSASYKRQCRPTEPPPDIPARALHALQDARNLAPSDSTLIDARVAVCALCDEYRPLKGCRLDPGCNNAAELVSRLSRMDDPCGKWAR